MPLTRSVLQKYCNPVFVETGTRFGDTVQLALGLGFKVVHSIEINPVMHGRAAKRFAGQANVHLHLGDTAYMLPRVVERLTERATILLDAHPDSREEPTPVGALDRWPLMLELELLQKAKGRKGHTILVDDRRVFGVHFGVTEEQVVAAIRRINPAYEIAFEADQYDARDVVAARVM
jgi:hypothetical protein